MRTMSDSPIEDGTDGERTTAEMRRVLLRAVGLADRLEPQFARHDAWPHGLGDLLADMLDVFETHEGREALWLKPGADEPDREIASALMADHCALERRLQDVQHVTAQLSPPAEAPRDWRRLYALCQVLRVRLLERMQREDACLRQAAA